MAWGRLALIQAAGENKAALQKTAKLFGYRPEAQQQEDESAGQKVGKQQPPKLSVAKKTEQRPPARFLRVNKRQQLENPDDAKPDYLSDETMRLQAKSGTYSFAPSCPLLPMSRLLPFLHNGLGQSRAVGKLDYQRLTKYLAEAKALRSLPYLSRQCWPQRLQIIIDASLRLEPYWADFAFITGRLKKLLGAEAVTALRFDEDTLGAEHSFCILWPTLDHHQWDRWQVPPADVAILILSDLGVTEAHPSARIRWQRLLNRLQAHPAPLLTLSPVARSPVNLPLCRQAKPNPLNDSYNLPRHPNRNGFRMAEPAAEQMAKLLALLSPLPVIDSGLLRRLRIELNWGGSELESLIWNHPDMRQTSLGICLQETVAENYRRQYRQHWQGTEQAKKLWQIVTAHHAKAFEGLRLLEALNWCVVEGADSEEVRDYFQRLCATVDKAEPGSVQLTALLGQCRTILALMPETVWRSPVSDLAYGVFGTVHADDIRAGRWPDKLPPGFETSQLQWLLDERSKAERVQWQVLQTGAQGQFTCRKIDSVRAESFGYPAQGFEQRLINGMSPPIATFEAQPAFPPILHFTCSDHSAGEVVKEALTFTLTTGVAVIETTLQRLELEAVGKPSWATCIWCNADGLFASIEWLGVTHTVFWQVGGASLQGHWDWPKPFGEDDFGLYADLELNGISQRFRRINPGTFMMGSPASEPERRENEIQHEVTLSQGYWLADTACTQALWQAVTGKNPSHFKDNPNNPVENVSWDDAQTFIEQLNRMVPKLKARLPTEAEWEYACRAGTTTPFSFGDIITPEQVNYDGNYPFAGGAKGLYREKTVPVKSLPVNPWGLYEMHGNVWEWCQDWYGDYKPEAEIDPVGADSGSSRVLRGGSWIYHGSYTRSAYRIRYVPAYRGGSFGFRLALG